MGKHKILAFMTLFMSFMASCQQQKSFEVSKTYMEPKDPSPDSESDWSQVPKELQVSVTSTNTRFVRSSIPKVNQNSSWSGEAWKGERISSQLVLWSSDSITNVSIKMSNFISEKGIELASDVSQIRFVKYVITDEFANGCGNRKPENFTSSLMPFIL